MNKTKKKQEKQNLSTGAIVAIVIGIVFIVAILADTFSTQESNEEEQEYYQNVYTEQAQVEENEFFNGNDFFEDNNDEEYEQTDAKWKQYVSILESDESKINKVIEDYCTGEELYKEDIDQCVNYMSPTLNSYSAHISNAQNFMLDEGDVFGNQIELLGYLDDKAVYTNTLANTLKTLVDNYNSQQVSNDYMIDEETLGTILKILAMTV